MAIFIWGKLTAALNPVEVSWVLQQILQTRIRLNFFREDQKSTEIGSYRQTVLTCRAADDVLAPEMVEFLPTHKEDNSARKWEIEKKGQGEESETREKSLKQV